uniref:C2H2-type domain-containing protein n=1 Tax=Syphacia muris TaxID=451379 RepID=A0A0N5AWD6_9BILA
MNEEESQNQKKEKRKVELRHVCCYCSKAFAFPNKLRRHIQAFHSLAHVCEHCNTRFDRFNELRTHVAFAHHIRYKCPVCAYSSNVKAELRKHVVVNHENGVCCTIDGCNVTVAYRNLKRHIREAHGKSNDLTGSEGFADNEVFLKKKRRKHSSKSVDVKFSVSDKVKDVDDVSKKCSLSDEVPLKSESIPSPREDLLNSEGSAVNRLNTGSAVNRLNTGSSSKLPTDDSSKSMPVDDEKKSIPSPRGELLDCEGSAVNRLNTGLFLCSITGCHKKFRRVKDLKRHKIHYHKVLTAAEEAEYKYVCEYPNCNRRFCTVGGLRQHSGCHGDEILINCDTCKRTFKNRASFATHLRKYHLLSIRQVNLSPAFVSVAAKPDVSVKCDK